MWQAMHESSAWLARLSSGGKRLPTFSVQLDPPLERDVELGAMLARSSGQRYGREADLVTSDRDSAAARVRGARARQLQPTPELPPVKARARNEHRPRKQRAEPRTHTEVMNATP